MLCFEPGHSPKNERPATDALRLCKSEVKYSEASNDALGWEMRQFGSFEGHKLQKIAASSVLYSPFQSKSCPTHDFVTRIAGKNQAKGCQRYLHLCSFHVECVLLLKIEILRFLPPMIVVYDVGLCQACDLKYQALLFCTCNNKKLVRDWGQGYYYYSLSI